MGRVIKVCSEAGSARRLGSRDSETPGVLSLGSALSGLPWGVRTTVALEAGPALQPPAVLRVFTLS